MKWYIKIYKFLQQLPLNKVFLKLKLWLRETVIGRVIDRGIRMFVLGVLIYFLENWTLGTNVFNLFSTAISVTLVGVIDKIKNEFLAMVRKESEDKGFSTL